MFGAQHRTAGMQTSWSRVSFVQLVVRLVSFAPRLRVASGLAVLFSARRTGASHPSVGTCNITVVKQLPACSFTAPDNSIYCSVKVGARNIVETRQRSVHKSTPTTLNRSTGVCTVTSGRSASFHQPTCRTRRGSDPKRGTETFTRL